MSRPTDLTIIEAYRTVSTELLTRFGKYVPMGMEQQAYDSGMDDLQSQLWGIGERLKVIHAAQAENVRISMCGGQE